MKKWPKSTILAETPGFEPGEPHSGLDGLANRWFQPLTHVSGSQRRGRAITVPFEMGKGGWQHFFHLLPLMDRRCG